MMPGLYDDNIKWPEPSKAEKSALESSLERIAAAYERMAYASEQQLQIATESLEIQRWMARDSQALRAEYEEGKQQ